MVHLVLLQFKTTEISKSTEAQRFDVSPRQFQKQIIDSLSLCVIINQVTNWYSILDIYVHRCEYLTQECNENQKETEKVLRMHGSSSDDETTGRQGTSADRAIVRTKLQHTASIKLPFFFSDIPPIPPGVCFVSGAQNRRVDVGHESALAFQRGKMAAGKN